MLNGKLNNSKHLLIILEDSLPFFLQTSTPVVLATINLLHKVHPVMLQEVGAVLERFPSVWSNQLLQLISFKHWLTGLTLVRHLQWAEPGVL